MYSEKYEGSYPLLFGLPISGLYYKLMTIVNDNSRVVNKLEASLTDNARVIIYDRHMFIVQATSLPKFALI
jgi:hypothetical protein